MEEWSELDVVERVSPQTEGEGVGAERRVLEDARRHRMHAGVQQRVICTTVARDVASNTTHNDAAAPRSSTSRSLRCRSSASPCTLLNSLMPRSVTFSAFVNTLRVRRPPWCALRRR